MKALIVIAGFICISTYKVACSTNSENSQEIISEENEANDAVPSPNRTEDEINKFREWQLRFRKIYRNAAEEQAAMEQLLKRTEEIEAHNRLHELGLVTFKRALWEHSDLSDVQRKKNLMGLEVPPEARIDLDSDLDSDQENPKNLPIAPEYVNWTEVGLVGPVNSFQV